MKNHVHGGTTARVTATAAIKSGDFVASGAIFGFAQKDAAIGEEVVIVTKEVFEWPVVSSTPVTQGAVIYYDGTGLTTATDDGGDPATAYVRAGRAWADGELDEAGDYVTWVNLD